MEDDVQVAKQNVPKQKKQPENFVANIWIWKNLAPRDTQKKMYLKNYIFQKKT